MNKKVKTGFKIFGLSLGIVVGAMAVVIFIMFLAGAFSPRHTELDNMHFTVNDEYNENNRYIIDSDSFITIVPEPDDTTEVEMELTITNAGGEELITLPDSYYINRPILIQVQKQKLTYKNAEGEEKEYEVNKGGIVTLKAKSISQPLDCSCTIFIDTFVEDYTIKATNENGEQLFIDENDNSAFYVQSLSGDYYYDEQDKTYKEIEKDQLVQGAKYIRQPIYPGNEFYIEIQDVFPVYSLEKYKDVLNEKAKEIFVGETSDNQVAIVSSTEVKGNDMRIKVTILNDGEVSISSSLINAYKNMLLKEKLDQMEFDSDSDREQYYTNVIKQFTLLSNKLTITANNIEIVDLYSQTTTIGQTENFTVGNTYTLNSTAENIDGTYGVGLVLKAPSNSIYKDTDLNSRLSDVTITAGYKDGDKFVESEEFIGVDKYITDGVLYVRVKCYKTNNLYQNFVQFSIDDFTTLVEIDFASENIPTFAFSEDEKLQLDLMIGKDTKPFVMPDDLLFDQQDEKSNALINISLISNNQVLDKNNYNIKYLIFVNNKLDTDNKLIENLDGELGYQTYKENLNGIYGYDEDEEKFFEIKNGYTGKRYDLVFKNGGIKLKRDAKLTDGVVNLEIYACIVKNDFDNQVINYHIAEDGKYGYYQGKIQLITDIEKDGIKYIGQKYDEGLYDYRASTNVFRVSVGQNFEVANVELVDETKDDVVDLKDKFSYDKDNKLVNITLNENTRYRLRVKHNKGTNYGSTEVNCLSNNVEIYPMTNDSTYAESEYMYFYLNAIKSSANETVTISFLDKNGEKILTIEVSLVINSIELAKIDFSVNDSATQDIEANIDSNTGVIEWRAVGQGASDSINFAMSFKTGTNETAEIDDSKLPTLRFIYITQVDNNGVMTDKESYTSDIITLTANKNGKNMEISYDIHKEGNVKVKVRYGEEGEYITSNIVALNITVPDIQFNGYELGIINGEISVNDSALVKTDSSSVTQGLELGNYVNISIKDYPNRTIHNSLKDYEITNNAYDGNNNKLFDVVNGKLIVSKQITQSYTLTIKVNTTFGKQVKDNQGNDVYLTVIVKPDANIVAKGTLNSDDNYEVNGVEYKLNGSKLTIKKDTIVNINDIIKLISSQNVEYNIIKLTKSNGSNITISNSTTIEFKNVSASNELTLHYLVNNTDGSTGDVAVFKLYVDIVDTF